ncbi:hypothetical protein MP638_004822 [Amoeboaphelidium occidentale]|nr:hypothetical protein MP638_004822 [Amoeboaphelidium occidentale]
MLYIVGLGLSDEKGISLTDLLFITFVDITVKGLEAIQSCDHVYLESYTSHLINLHHTPSTEDTTSLSKLEAFYGKKIAVADREFVEMKCDDMLEQAKTQNVAFLVVGDPFGATTHTDLELRALELGVKVTVIHNASVMNAVGACGLQLYNFGQTVSIVFFPDNEDPATRSESYYDKIKKNISVGLHTLCLLDIRVKEPDLKKLIATGKMTYEPPRYMTVNQALYQLYEIEKSRNEGVLTENTLVVGIARLGSHDQQIVSGPLKQVMDNVDFGAPLHCLVIPAESELHCLELESLKRFSVECLNEKGR